MIVRILALGLSFPKGVCQNPHLLTRPDRSDPAIDLIGFVGWVLGPFCHSGRVGRFRLIVPLAAVVAVESEACEALVAQ
jgi:hypothetical protein